MHTLTAILSNILTLEIYIFYSIEYEIENAYRNLVETCSL